MSFLRQDEGSATGGAAKPLRTFLSPGYAICDSRFQFVGNGMTSTSCFSQHQSVRPLTRSHMTFHDSWLFRGSTTGGVLSQEVSDSKKWTCDRAVSGTAGTEHEMAHTPRCNHDSREKTENTLPSPSASQRLNEAAACLSALRGQSQISHNEAVPLQDIFEI